MTKPYSLKKRMLDILADHDVFMDVPNPIIASTLADKLTQDLTLLFSQVMEEVIGKEKKLFPTITNDMTNVAFINYNQAKQEARQRLERILK